MPLSSRRRGIRRASTKSKVGRVEGLEGWKDGRVEGLEGWKDGRMEGWKDWKDGRMEGWKGGRMEGWIRDILPLLTWRAAVPCSCARKALPDRVPRRLPGHDQNFDSGY